MRHRNGAGGVQFWKGDMKCHGKEKEEKPCRKTKHVTPGAIRTPHRRKSSGKNKRQGWQDQRRYLHVKRYPPRARNHWRY